jgi:hypothetical protein
MPENENIKQIRELLEKLTPEEKQQFISELAEDDDLMSALLEALVTRNNAPEDSEEGITNAEGYVNFLRKFKG